MWGAMASSSPDHCPHASRTPDPPTSIWSGRMPLGRHHTLLTMKHFYFTLQTVQVSAFQRLPTSECLLFSSNTRKWWILFIRLTWIHTMLTLWGISSSFQLLVSVSMMTAPQSQSCGWRQGWEPGSSSPGPHSQHAQRWCIDFFRQSLC